MTFILKFTPDASDGMGKYKPTASAYYFTHFHAQWPYAPERRMIGPTTTEVAKARQFDTEQEGNETLAIAGNPKGWEVVEVAE
jgi:hypothetical protein